MMPNARLAFLILLFGCLVAVPVAGQVRLDPVSRDYFVTITGDNGQPIEMRVVPPNKVAAVVAGSATSEAGLMRYTYTVSVDGASAQPLRYFQIVCPRSARFDTFTGVRVSAGVTRSGGGALVQRGNEQVCTFDGTVQPGGTLTASLRSDLLPAIGHVRLIGRTPGVSWPTEEPVEEESVRRAVDSLSGITGGWLEMTTIVPLRPTAAMSGAAGLALVRADLDEACALGWISNPGLCHRLQEKLEHAAQSLERRNGSEEARRQLGEFLEELEDQHGPEPGRHADESREPEARHDPEPGKPVNAGAYWLLKINVEYLRGLIPGREAGER